MYLYLSLKTCFIQYISILIFFFFKYVETQNQKPV